MPKHSKTATTTAARLPKSRLPAGAQLPDNIGACTRPSSRATNDGITPSSHTSPADTSSTDGGGGNPADHDNKQSPPAKSVVPAMSTISTSAYSDHGGIALSTAAAKLRRQNERIQQAEAALAVPAHTTSQRPSSHDKGKPTYKKMPIGWDIAGQHPHAEDGVHATPTERRINTFYPSKSRESSLSRSISSMSNMPAAFDIERHDSMMIDNGFQYPRRGKPVADQLRPYEDKPEVKQKTVEASFDKDEIHKVFGIDLPPLEFLHMNPGYNDAQLQFVMHPNGDVGAHMWSMNRFQWENIGNFSNIRKRVEGQLASDRLKGETAWQTLQKNTLAYFRAISKQREQTTMGLPFGQPEILQIMGPPPEQPTMPRLAKAEAPKSCFFTTTGNQVDVQMEAQRQQQESAIRQQAIVATHGAVRIHPQRHLPVAIPAGPRSSHPDQYSFNPRPQPEHRSDDPFAAAMPLSRYGAPAKSGLSASVDSFHPMNYQYSQAASIQRDYVPPHLRSSPSGRLIGLGTDSASSATFLAAAHPSMLPPYKSGTGNAPAQRQLSIDSMDTPSRPKPVTPLHTREAMRDQLRKLGETAKERSTSQGGRTVLYDPLGSIDDTTDEEEEPFPDFSQRVTTTAARTHPNERDLKSAYNARLGGWQDSQPTLPTPQRRWASLGDSVPDTDFPQSSSESRVTSGAYSVLRPSRISEDVEALKAAVPPTVKAKKLSPEEELDEWWFSRSKYARQEEFFQSIKALSLRSEPDSPASTSTPSRLVPIVARVSKASPARHTTASSRSIAQAKVPWDEGLTRALIPVYENLAAYVEGPVEKRRDYFSNWCKPPEWAIDRSPNGNNSFFDNTWGQPPARLSRDPRYRSMPGESRYNSGGFTTGGVPIASPPPALSGGLPGMSSGRFGFGGNAY